MSPGYLLKSFLNRVAGNRFLLHRHSRLSGNALALTFDDGPHEQNTPRILQTLDKLQIKATFFIQGNEAKRYSGLVRELLAAGHQIGNHGYNHLDCRKVPLVEYISDVEDARKLLEDISGSQLSRIFRPPYGSVTPQSFLQLNRLGYTYVFWSADSRDSFIRTPDELRRHVLELALRSGDVMLFHEDYDHTLLVLDDILSSLIDRGFRFATVDDFLGADRRQTESPPLP